MQASLTVMMRLALSSSLILALALWAPAGAVPARARIRSTAAGPADGSGVLAAQSRSCPSRTATSGRTICCRTRSVFQYVIPELLTRAKPGGVYLGVGPEQNFTYIAALKPQMAFIIDIRRGNLHMQLMYKALFEMSADRAEFVSRLFTKPRPAGLTDEVDGRARTDAARTGTSTRRRGRCTRQNLQAINDAPARRRTDFRSPQEDLAGIEYVYYAFYWFGPSITYARRAAAAAAAAACANYADLMVATDAAAARSAAIWRAKRSSSSSRTSKRRICVVPVVGNFGGPKAMRAVGAYVRSTARRSTAFYLSNVEQYLQQDGIWGTSARTSRRCRSTRPARSSGRRAAARLGGRRAAVRERSAR